MKLQIIPDRQISNSKVIGLLENTHYYRPLIKRINKTKEGKEVYYGTEEQYTTAFEILMNKDNTNFYISFDDRLKDNMLTELNICWKDATFKASYENKVFNNLKELELAEHYFLSLKTDLRGEYPLSNILETQNILKDNEEILVRIEMKPVCPSWDKDMEECIKNFNKGKITTKTLLTGKNAIYKAGETLLDISYFVMDFINDMIIDVPLEHDRIADSRYSGLLRKGLSKNTKEKSRYNGYDTKIIIGINSYRSEVLFSNMFRAFKTMTGDNSFIMLEKSRYKNKLSSKELAQILQMPTKTYQELYRINNISGKEVNVPSQLLYGSIQIGQAKYKGNEAMAYWPDNENIISLPKIVMGPMGSGKTEYSKTFAVEAAKKGDSVIIFDYIKDCELSNDIAKYVRAIKIDLSNENQLYALAYPELQPRGTKWERLKAANILARQTEYLINSLVDEILTPRMSRYLDAACKVVYVHENPKVSEVMDVLTNWKVRNEYIRKARYGDNPCFGHGDPEIIDLLALNETDVNGKIIGTNETKIEGILDRITVLNKDLYLRTMLKAEVNYNQNFAKWMDEGATILIQIPESTYTNKAIKDTLVTYYMSRIWLAALQRKNHNKICHVITDEIHQVPTAAALVGNIITEARKFGIDFYFTIHYLKQFRQLHDAVRSAGCSYMLLAGTEKENLRALEEELQPFSIQEGLNLKPFHSLNVINYGNQYAKFISKLPKPI